MRYALSLLLLPALASAAPAQDREAEKLYRDMEQKIRSAKAVQFGVTLEIQGPAKEDRGGTIKGSVLFTKDNQARLKIGGEVNGEKLNHEIVSDGKQIRLKPYAAMPDFKEEATFPTPKHLHRTLTTVLPRAGVHLTFLVMSYLVREGDVEDIAKLGDKSRLGVWDFKAGAAEKVGGRDAKVVSYRVGEKDDRDSASVTVWIDSRTLAPLKLVIVANPRDAVRYTETYSDFTFDPRIDARAFELK